MRSHRDLYRLESDNSIAGVNYISCIFGGWIFSLIMVLVSQKRSEYARFHAIQCLAYHIVLTGVSMVVTTPMTFYFMKDWFAQMASMSSSPPPGPEAMFGMMFKMYAAMWPMWVFTGLLMLINLSIAIAGMVQAFRCRDFAIPLVGQLTMKWFFKEPPATVMTVA